MMEEYNPREWASTPTKKKPDYKLLKTIAALLICVGFGYMISGITSDGISEDVLNETVINAYSVGYETGIYDVSQSVLQTGILPVFINSSEGITLNYLNLTSMEFLDLN